MIRTLTLITLILFSFSACRRRARTAPPKKVEKPNTTRRVDPPKKPKPKVSDYQELAEEILDGVFALSTRFAELSTMAWPENRNPESVDYHLKHEAGARHTPDGLVFEKNGIALEVHVYLGPREGEDLRPVKWGELCIVVRAHGPRGPAVEDAVQRVLGNMWTRFWQHFDLKK